MADVKWIKIVTDIFDDEKMYAIETLSDGMVIELIWFKILCIAGKSNSNGFLVISDKIPYTDEMLSKVFRIEIGIVQRALEIFQKLDMIELVDNAYMVSNWSKYQSGDRLEEIKEQNRIRQQRHRDKQKEQRLIEEQRNVTNNVTNNVNCSISYSYSSSKSNYIQEIIDYLNSKAGTKYKSTTRKTAQLIEDRMREGYTVDDFKIVIDKKCGEWNGTKRAQYLTPSTLFSPEHFDEYLNQKIIKEEKKPDQTQPSRLGKFGNFKQRAKEEQAYWTQKIIEANMK